MTDAELTKLVGETQNAFYSEPTKTGAYAALAAQEIANCIDHTLLKVDATPQQIDNLCAEAREWAFKAVCVRLKYVNQAVMKLQGTSVLVCSVVGFPEGTQSTEEKLRLSLSIVPREAVDAHGQGARELDTVINVNDLRSQTYSKILRELKAFRTCFPKSTGSTPGTTLKLILETSQLSEEEIIAACKLASLADFDFVKTSTGFLGHGARVEHVMLMSRVAAMEGKGMKVKASGGIKTLDDAMQMLAAGADRLGVSAGVAIVRESIERETKG